MATVKQISSMSELQRPADNTYDIGSPRVIVEERKNRDNASVSYSTYFQLSPGGLSKLPYLVNAVNVQDLLTSAAKAFANTRGKNKVQKYENALNKQHIKEMKAHKDEIEKQLLAYIPKSMRGWTQSKVTTEQLEFLRKQNPQSNTTKKLSGLIDDWDYVSTQLNPQKVTANPAMIARQSPQALTSEPVAQSAPPPKQGAPLTVMHRSGRLGLLGGSQASRKLVKRKNHTKRAHKTK